MSGVYRQFYGLDVSRFKSHVEGNHYRKQHLESGSSELSSCGDVGQSYYEGADFASVLLPSVVYDAARRPLLGVGTATLGLSVSSLLNPHICVCKPPSLGHCFNNTKLTTQFKGW